MPTTRKRRPRHQRRVLLSDESVDAFRHGDWMRLHRALRLKPWEANPLDVDENSQPDESRPGYGATIAQAVELRAALTSTETNHGQ